MFKIVASFTRPNTDHDFFSDIYLEYDVIKNLQIAARKNTGFVGLDENIFRDDFRCDKAMCFDSYQSFLQFVTDNKELLDQRSKMIEEYCVMTKHVYKYYVIET